MAASLAECLPRLDLAGGDLRYDPDFLSENDADRLLEELLASVSWQERRIRVYGREVLSPRLTAWYGDPGAHYSYSGLSLDPLPWISPLLELRGRIERCVGSAFNAVLANQYRDGSDSMGWHSDAEPELGDDPVIASISMGAARRFLLRSRAPGVEASLDLALSHGSLLLMGGATQRLFRHSVPKTRRPVGVRVNLSFRRILSPRSQRDGRSPAAEILAGSS